MSMTIENSPAVCDACKRPVKSHILLELHAINGTWHLPGTITEEESQGCFPFGTCCARKFKVDKK